MAARVVTAARIRDDRIAAALREVPRHLFLPQAGARRDLPRRRHRHQARCRRAADQLVVAARHHGDHAGPAGPGPRPAGTRDRRGHRLQCRADEAHRGPIGHRGQCRHRRRRGRPGPRPPRRRGLSGCDRGCRGRRRGLPASRAVRPGDRHRRREPTWRPRGWSSSIRAAGSWCPWTYAEPSSRWRSSVRTTGPGPACRWCPAGSCGCAGRGPARNAAVPLHPGCR